MHNLCTDNKMIRLMVVVGHSSTDDQQRVCVGCGPCKGDVDGRISAGRGHMPCHRPYAHTGWAIRSSRGLLKAREGLNGPARHILLYDPSTSHIIGQVRFKICTYHGLSFGRHWDWDRVFIQCLRCLTLEQLEQRKFHPKQFWELWRVSSQLSMISCHCHVDKWRQPA